MNRVVRQGSLQRRWRVVRAAGDTVRQVSTARMTEMDG